MSLAPSAPPNRDSVSVVVRFRPFNDREKKSRSEHCFALEDRTVTVQRSNATSKFLSQDRAFTFDVVYPIDAGQEAVYNGTARRIIRRVLQGYNGCVFAYGQTGAGKTYTMNGTPHAPGVIPRLCDELFHLTASDATHLYSVRASYLEIYQERLRDLLVAAQTTVPLQIREEKGRHGRGIFVQNATEAPVSSSADVLELMTEGMRRRTVGATQMNDQSSRSHAVFSLSLDIRDTGDREGLTARTAKLHLIDLAGSERQSGTGATGERLREGAHINQSLSALGNVIVALTKEHTPHVPYRDSKLTRLLQTSLGGNSLTVMIANVSPASVNLEESLSTLRFAERAKLIRNKPVINRDPKSAKIAELQAEVARLRAALAKCHCGAAAELSAHAETGIAEGTDEGFMDEIDLDAPPPPSTQPAGKKRRCTIL